VSVCVRKWSTIQVAKRSYSVPSRLIGHWVEARVYADVIEVRYNDKTVETLPRLRGNDQHRIDYRHIIWSLVRKPGAFAAYRYRDDLFPTTTFRLAYDRLVSSGLQRADRDYVRLLHLAASTSESEVETALALLLEASTLPTFDAVRDLVHPPRSGPLLGLCPPDLDLSPYDNLIPSRRTYA